MDICNILSFPEPASEKKPAPVTKQGAAQHGGPGPGITVTKQEAPNGDGPQRKEARCNVKSASTPSTPVKVSSRQISKSSGLMKLGERVVYLGVSKNDGIPKSSILIGFAIINHPFWGTLIFGNTHFFLEWIKIFRRNLVTKILLI